VKDKKHEDLPPIKIRIKDGTLTVSADKRCSIQLVDHLVLLLQKELRPTDSLDRQLLFAELTVEREMRRLMAAKKVVRGKTGVWLARIPIVGKEEE
jgi:hypothetical protein